jgi:hypothetical protein
MRSVLAIAARELVAAFAILLIASNSVQAQTPGSAPKLSPEQVREEKAYVAGVLAAIWGQPLVDNAHTLGAALKVGAVGLNYYRKFPDLKTAADKFVNTPNNVSIDGYGAADLGTEPVVVSVPALTEKRWYIVQIGDYYDQVVYNIGGSKGAEPGLFLLTGPEYHGPIPAGMREIKVRTRLAVIANRVFVSGEADLPAARAVQKGFHLLPLSVFQSQGLRYEIPKQPDISRYQFAPSGPEALRVFETIGFGMKTFLTLSDDFGDADVGAARQIGLSVAKGFDWQSSRRAHQAWPRDERRYDGNGDHRGHVRERGGERERLALHDGRGPGRGELRRACGLGGEPDRGQRAGGDPLSQHPRRRSGRCASTGANEVRPAVRCKDKLPPVSVFWNLNMYDEKEFFIENDFKRYSIGSTTDGLKKNPDGSITVLIQNERPADTSNWLPAPKGDFNLTMRFYGAQSPILDGSYRLPGVRVQP